MIDRLTRTLFAPRPPVHSKSGSLRKKICDLQPCNLGCLDFPTVRDAIFQAEHGLIGEIDYRTIGLPQRFSRNNCERRRIQGACPWFSVLLRTS